MFYLQETFSLCIWLKKNLHLPWNSLGDLSLLHLPYRVDGKIKWRQELCMLPWDPWRKEWGKNVLRYIDKQEKYAVPPWAGLLRILVQTMQWALLPKQCSQNNPDGVLLLESPPDSCLNKSNQPQFLCSKFPSYSLRTSYPFIAELLYWHRLFSLYDMYDW